VIIADDPTISRAHAEISVGGDGVARVRDLSKFGTKIDGARVDRSLPAGVPLLAAAPGADRDRVRLTFGGKTPVATVAVLVRVDDGDASLATRADSDATTAGEEEEEDDGGALAAPGRPGDEDASSLSRRNAARVQPEPRRGGALPSAVSAASVALARAAADRRRAARDSADRAEAADGEAPAETPALHAEAPAEAPALNAEAPASPRRERDAAYAAREGKSTVVFESIKASRSRETAEPAGRRADPRNFKKFRKASSSRGGASGGGGSTLAARRRRVVRYADEAYDALHQWEDADVAARHEAARRDARTADEMFETGNEGAGQRSGAAAGKRKAAAAPRKPRGAAAKGR